MAFLNQTLFGSLSKRSRLRKLELFRELIALNPETRILDIGAQVGDSQLIDAHPYRERITAVNLEPEHLDRIRATYPEVSVQVADARKLPFPDKSFDLAYSSAVIEHVGSLKDQAAMAQEMKRVARSWFVTTPNRWYPFEFHARLPFVGWLPASLMERVVRTWSYDHGNGRYRSGVESQTRLMTARELRQLFPESKVMHVQITFWPETLVAAGGELPRRRAD